MLLRLYFLKILTKLSHDVIYIQISFVMILSKDIIFGFSDAMLFPRADLNEKNSPKESRFDLNPLNDLMDETEDITASHDLPYSHMFSNR